MCYTATLREPGLFAIRGYRALFPCQQQVSVVYHTDTLGRTSFAMRRLGVRCPFPCCVESGVGVIWSGSTP